MKMNRWFSILIVFMGLATRQDYSGQDCNYKQHLAWIACDASFLKGYKGLTNDIPKDDSQQEHWTE